MSPKEAAHKRPLVLVTGPDRGGTPAWLLTALNLWLAGARPRRITPVKFAKRGFPAFDALVLGGGADIDPKLYGQSLFRDMSHVHLGPKPRKRYWLFALVSAMIYILRRLFSIHRVSGFLDKGRDAMELALLERAWQKRIPVLGICRGAQLINVFFRGSLHQDIRGFYSEYPQYRTAFPRKVVHIHGHSHLFEILRMERCLVNALHNQSVAKPAEGLEAVAWEANGIIQAIEPKDKGVKMLGVQWHPEYLLQKREQRSIFRWLVQAAASAFPPRQEHELYA